MSKPSAPIKSELRFHRSILEHVTSGAIAIDPQGKITYINRKVTELLGYDSGRLINQSILFLLPEHKGSVKDLLTNKAASRSSVKMKHKRGYLVPVSFFTNLVDGASDDFVIVFGMDEKKLEQANEDRLERLATLGELSIGIAHELRNPLAGIKSVAQLMDEYLEKKGDQINASQMKEFARRIVNGVNRSNDLLTDFFKFAQPAKARPDYTDIEMLIHGVYLLLAPMMRKTKVTFETDFSHYVPQVYVDESQIEQAMFNVFVNAVDAMKPAGGTLRILPKIEKRVVTNTQGAGEEHKMVAIHVEDEGSGISTEIQPKIFNPFFTTKVDHVGLGLAIASRLIEQNNGWIEIESKVNRGSVFTLLIPCV